MKFSLWLFLRWFKVAMEFCLCERGAGAFPACPRFVFCLGISFVYYFVSGDAACTGCELLVRQGRHDPMAIGSKF
jgi:hypothetical protein